jgi:hypothetical protein
VYVLLFSQYVRCVLHQGKPPDWQDFVGIITLLLINSTISFIEENNAGNAAAALMARLAPKAKVQIHFIFPCTCMYPLFGVHLNCRTVILLLLGRFSVMVVGPRRRQPSLCLGTSSVSNLEISFLQMLAS